jgi:hypothetical protein
VLPGAAARPDTTDAMGGARSERSRGDLVELSSVLENELVVTELVVFHHQGRQTRFASLQYNILRSAGCCDACSAVRAWAGPASTDKGGQRRQEASNA